MAKAERLAKKKLEEDTEELFKRCKGESWIMDTEMIEKLEPALPTSEYFKKNPVKGRKPKKKSLEKMLEESTEPKKTKKKKISKKESGEKKNKTILNKDVLNTSGMMFEQKKELIEKKLMDWYGKIPDGCSIEKLPIRGGETDDNPDGLRVLIHIKGESRQRNYDNKGIFKFGRFIKRFSK